MYNYGTNIYNCNLVVKKGENIIKLEEMVIFNFRKGQGVMFHFEMTDYDKKVFETELKDFLPDEFIDFHTHIGRVAFAYEGKPNGGSTWTSRVYDEMTTFDLLEAYEKMFPGKKVTPLIFGDCVHNVKQLNEYVFEEGNHYKLPKLYRTSYEIDADKLEEDMKKGGFIGIKPYQTFCPPYIPVNEIRIFDFLKHEHLDVMNKNGWIVMLHTPRNGRLKDPVDLAQLLEIEEKYPNIKLVVAHIGRAYAKEDIGNAFDILKHTKNMYFDFTANVCDDAIKACIKAVGPKRLIFGSDMPIAIMRMYRIVENGVYYNVVPRGLYGDVTNEAHMRETDETDVTIMMYEQLRAFKRVATELKLTDCEIENVMYGNAKRLLDLYR